MFDKERFYLMSWSRLRIKKINANSIGSILESSAPWKYIPTMICHGQSCLLRIGLSVILEFFYLRMLAHKNLSWRTFRRSWEPVARNLPYI